MRQKSNTRTVGTSSRKRYRYARATNSKNTLLIAGSDHVNRAPRTAAPAQAATNIEAELGVGPCCESGYEELLSSGIVITGGGNKQIDTVPAGDDRAEDTDGNGVKDTITPGFDRVLQSRPAGDDRYWDDVLMFVIGGSNGQRGFSSLLQPQHGQRSYYGYGPAYPPFIMALRAGAHGASST